MGRLSTKKFSFLWTDEIDRAFVMASTPTQQIATR